MSPDKCKGETFMLVCLGLTSVLLIISDIVLFVGAPWEYVTVTLLANLTSGILISLVAIRKLVRGGRK